MTGSRWSTLGLVHVNRTSCRAPLADSTIGTQVLDEKLRRMKARIPEEPPVRSGEVQSQHFLFNGDGSVKPSLLGPPPQIKILKRPTQNGAGGPGSDSTGAAKPRQQVKTLQQVKNCTCVYFSVLR